MKNIGSVMLDTSFYACLFACWTGLSSVKGMPDESKVFYTAFLVTLVMPWQLATHVRLSIVMALGASCALVPGILGLWSLKPGRLPERILTELATAAVATLLASIIFLGVACTKRFLSRALKNLRQP